jgi:hypothetical protein
VRSVAGKLPANRVFEVYVSVDQIMNTVGPMAATFGALPAFEPLPAMSPIGIGMAMGSSGMQTSIHMPLDVIKAMMAFAAEMENAGFEDEPEPASRPRF